MTHPDSAGSTPIGPVETPDVSERGIGDLVRDVANDLSTLLSQELELAKTEMALEAKKAGKTAGSFGGAGLAAFFALLFGSLTVVFALALLFDSYVWAALVVTLLWAVVAAVLFLRARKQAKALNPVPEMTVQSVKEDARWARTRRS